MYLNKQLIGGTFWALGPIWWGFFTSFMAWGYGGMLFGYQPLNFLIRVLTAIAAITYFFGKSLNQAEQTYYIKFFAYTLKVPSWRYFVIAIFVGCAIYFTPLRQYEVMHSLVLGILISSIIEEFVTRSIFVRYDMPLRQFLLLNIITSTAFTYMHTFYEISGVSILQLIQNGHFQFSFALGLLIYKTKRIELTMLIHMLANILNYTLPVCVLNCPHLSIVASTSRGFFGEIYVLALAGCYAPQAYAYKKYFLEEQQN